MIKQPVTWGEGWESFSSDYESWCGEQNDTFYLVGVITSQSCDNPIFTLPKKYHPTERNLIPVATSDGAKLLELNQDGEIKLAQGDGVEWVAFELRFGYC